MFVGGVVKSTIFLESVFFFSGVVKSPVPEASSACRVPVDGEKTGVCLQGGTVPCFSVPGEGKKTGVSLQGGRVPCFSGPAEGRVPCFSGPAEGKITGLSLQGGRVPCFSCRLVGFSSFLTSSNLSLEIKIQGLLFTSA